MDSIVSYSNVFYPPMGIVHITHQLSDLFEDKIKGKEKIVIRTSSQPNSNPHLGTITTIMTCFAIAEYLQKQFNLETEIVFDVLENSPAETCEYDGVKYQISLKDKIVSGRSKYEEYIKGFDIIFDFMQEKTGIKLIKREYSEFQQIPHVRKSILKIINNIDDFVPILSPSKKQIHLRFPCPQCGLTDKYSKNLSPITCNDDYAEFECYCPQHGKFTVDFSTTNTQFIDANTPIRDILQGVVSIEENSNIFSLMIDGNDWSGVWALHVFCRGLLQMGYKEIPPRIFAPLILDWSGAKFSKSLYLKSDAYKYLPDGFTDMSKFMSIYGYQGLNKLWEEIQTWADETKKLFRNYSVDYFKLILS
jgi:hypothetical protein